MGHAAATPSEVLIIYDHDDKIQYKRDYVKCHFHKNPWLYIRNLEQGQGKHNIPFYPTSSIAVHILLNYNVFLSFS